MALRKGSIPLPALLFLLVTSGCGKFGQVNQGRVIHYDREKGLVSFIQDSNYMQPGKPRFDILPPVTIKIPADRNEMGPAPEAGKLIAVDCDNRRAVIFDAATQRLKNVDFTLVDRVDNVPAGDARVAGVKFPVVDRNKKTIAVYSAAQRQLVSFSVPDEYFLLPADTWTIGDEIRYYYKDPGQALRLMNITKTDLNRASK